MLKLLLFLYTCTFAEPNWGVEAMLRYKADILYYR